MTHVNCWLLALAFVLGLVLTLAFMIRRVKREVPVYGAGKSKSKSKLAEPKTEVVSKSKLEEPKTEVITKSKLEEPKTEVITKSKLEAPKTEVISKPTAAAGEEPGEEP